MLDCNQFPNIVLFTEKTEYNSFVEQCICCFSKIFIYSTFNNEFSLDLTHTRSTWSSFVLDYRIFQQNNFNNISIRNFLTNKNEN